jgi:glutamate carboxypeptidase
MIEPATLLGHFRDRLDAMSGALRTLVEHESPSRDKASLDTLGAVLASRLEAAGGRIERVANPSGGDHLVARFFEGTGEPPALLLGHFDTVWPLGTLGRLPWRAEGGRASGPGVFDMKAGLVLIGFALRGLRELGGRPRRPIVVLLTSDEEVGSPTSRTLIESTARGASHALVLEPPLPGGRLKTARKGVGGFTVAVEGRAAHAGVEPEKGVSAVVELAHQILNIERLSRPEAGTTVNVGLIRGGTASNTVPARAEARVDVRASTPEEALRVESDLRALSPVSPGATIRVEGGFNRPPMVRTPAIAALFQRARAIGRSLGLELGEGSTGGGSDGNFTAALGVPTLDGLGAPGGGAHADDEHIELDALPGRAALLAALTQEL